MRLRSAGTKALIPYITPEYPVKGSTVPVLQALAAAGADMIEVGMPFSDPLADGKTIQQSSETALRNGARLPLILDAVRQFRRSSSIPVILMGYMNPIFRFGVARFTETARDAGVDGLIVADLPPEEAGELLDASQSVGLSNVFLIAPTTRDERMKWIDRHSTDFSYCVSVTGVTGARARFGTNGSFGSFLQRVRSNTTKPFVVGFGISTAAHVQEVWQYADGAVVGSALIDRMEGAGTSDEAAQRAGDFLSSLRST